MIFWDVMYSLVDRYHPFTDTSASIFRVSSFLVEEVCCYQIHGMRAHRRQ